MKTAPGIVGAALLTALVGALVAYFAPKLLDSLTGHTGIKVSVETNPAEVDTFNDLSQSMVVPRGKAIEGSPQEGCRDFAAWGSSVGAVRAGRTDLRLIVQGVGDQILISGIRARVTERRRPLAGTGVQCPSAGAKSIRSVVIDLDEASPDGVVVDGARRSDVAFTVGPDETEVFDVTAWTASCDCKWLLELIATQDGEQKVVTIDDDGQEFETTAWSPNPLAEFPSFPGPYYSWNFLDTWYLQTGNDIVDEYPANGTLPARASVK